VSSSQASRPRHKVLERGITILEPIPFTLVRTKKEGVYTHVILANKEEHAYMSRYVDSCICSSEISLVASRHASRSTARDEVEPSAKQDPVKRFRMCRRVLCQRRHSGAAFEIILTSGVTSPYGSAPPSVSQRRPVGLAQRKDLRRLLTLH